MAGVPDQQKAIAFLSRPENLEATGVVERVDTHAAIVFLAGDRAYKLKRAVRFGYLDFSTVDKRRVACEAELKLNRRTAPELYLGICSLNAHVDGSVGFGPGDPVEWLVVMRRFSKDDLLLAVAERGELTDKMARELADRIATFHDATEIVPAEHGAVRVRGVIEGNCEAMASVSTDTLTPDQCAALHERSLVALERLGPILDRRGRNGHVRHCHGDLHLANICLWKGRPTLFDCLEFDPELARIDVLYDLAFLLMDLWHKGLREQASIVFNRYFDMRDESDGICALPLFLSMRAAVRAHVTAAAVERQKDEPRRIEKCDEARAYLEAALRFLDPPPSRLIAVGGLSGTGKSTLSAALAPEIGGAPGARWLRTDVLRKRLAGISPEQPLPPEAYTRERNTEVYQHLMGEAAATLKMGRSVIVDGVFADPVERMEIEAVARAVKVPFSGLWLEAPRETMHARVAARSNDASDADAKVVDRQLGYELGDIASWYQLDASGTRQAVRDLALEVVDERQLGLRS